MAASPRPDCPEAQTLCLQADRTGGIDLKAGTAFMEGNVMGFLRKEGIAFTSETLKAFRNAAGEWVKFELDRDVHIEQDARLVDADHGILERKEILLYGNVSLHDEQMEAYADEARIDRETEFGVFTARRNELVRIKFLAHMDAPPTQEGDPAAPATDTFLIKTQRAELDNLRRDVRLQGQTEVFRVERNWKLTAQDVHLVFTPERTLDFFRAEGSVVVKQPGRIASADSAVSRNRNETILLVGNARVMQDGQFDLSSERIEMYNSVDKGLVQSDEQHKPLSLNLTLDKPDAYRLGEPGLDKLSTQGLPNAVREKLKPLVDQPYASAEVFDQAVRERLSAEETRNYLVAIRAAAKR
ncbi:MAG: hypothetical protein HY342_07780 [Candidatus Lambdaproteobacteria bacterium]|nr:hypothetical protein [Candidatus Lambdaproteobacteria bacterium]